MSYNSEESNCSRMALLRGSSIWNVEAKGGISCSITPEIPRVASCRTAASIGKRCVDSRSEPDSSIICVISFLVGVSTVLQHHIVTGSADTLRIDHDYRTRNPSISLKVLRQNGCCFLALSQSKHENEKGYLSALSA